MNFAQTTIERKNNFEYILSLIPSDRSIMFSELLTVSSLTLSQIKPYLETLVARGEVSYGGETRNYYYYRTSFAESCKAAHAASKANGAANV